MTNDPEKFVEVMSEVVAMPIPDEYRESVVANFQRIQTVAQLVLEFPLPEEIEIAPVFEP
ncbi:hypothetical protein NIES2135_33840 [Leptolyngbya boryana NIES-2135]|jgi:hypothetical protein|uniref:DUF4089 domain-containing protein n=1 Tax=Leptolyngbya boryana NIES-2135 TaxID=1973484 RepID=A0A1Z4JIJ4_LEPBY|nr:MULTISPECIES: DUF4089 domain-containing protein [Leptolyngbya]BAY56550.1 hypothetical protein NIES2135_33840 [Leptolyngbya boryana NIES-2135]MBD2369855.1 DUF4089 domain-containing protein [Leptolyngbya sp. FACHB-161]MBD2376200.1 DUF4089 domain-containing protein [Leptolyngbya sp. FACHB-238]MBD2400475.1 DUF4089 domain-containing protein [Leptolyngbya sp. FACHB-239]MBD2407017.1 DUF4089 domain-containing protein [Leptolyngbya sp. FACHB-402]